MNHERNNNNWNEKFNVRVNSFIGFIWLLLTCYYLEPLFEKKKK